MLLDSSLQKGSSTSHGWQQRSGVEKQGKTFGRLSCTLAVRINVPPRLRRLLAKSRISPTNTLRTLLPGILPVHTVPNLVSTTESSLINAGWSFFDRYVKELK